MEKMRLTLITLFLFISVVVAEEAGVSETTKAAEETGSGEAINSAEKVGTGETINPAEEADLAKHVGISKAINHMLNSQPPAYESPRFKKFVKHCSSHVAEKCSGSESLHHNEGGIYTSFGVALCLFDSMEACLVDHGASLDQRTPTSKDNNQSPQYLPKPARPIQYVPVLIETVKFRTVMRTCSHVSAQSCVTGSNVDASVLAACLMPSLNQCVYPSQVDPPDAESPPIRA
ncbi:unnamed protein product [Sphenostylis stenocarpa]|uniref:Uncharacterized protein n=1 Tax=Sphenostylis stenocarpa TaxID=92480 RepID=A0AA86SUR2_9FABA|nr:unnamed protein product [Sphenostylis stenocarpa]